MEDNIFKEVNNKNYNQYTNPTLTGKYENVEEIKVVDVKTEEELANNISKGEDIVAKPKEKESIENLLKSDHVTNNTQELDIEDAKFNNNKFINITKEEIIHKKEENAKFNGFDNLYKNIVPTENKITNEYEIPNLQLGEQNKNNQ